MRLEGIENLIKKIENREPIFKSTSFDEMLVNSPLDEMFDVKLDIGKFAEKISGDVMNADD